jgi:hypothetical protein
MNPTTSQLSKVFGSDTRVEAGERSVEARISTAAVDRAGDVLMPSGVNLKNFKANPVVYLAHDYYSLPVGKAVAIKSTDSAIIAKTEFASRPDDYPADKEWLPDTLLSLYQQGVLRGWSVGLNVIEARAANKRDVESYGGDVRRVITKWELVEYSVAPIPMNQEALTLAVAKGYCSPEAAKAVLKYEPGPVRVRIVIPA